METKNRIVKGSKVPSINLSKEILSLLIRLEDSESKEILIGIRDYVYKGKEPYVSEDVEDIMEMVLDNVNYIASKHLNGKKGGKPKKNNTELQPNTEFDTEAKISPNKPINTQDDIDIPQEAESASEGPKQAEFDNSIEMFEKAYSDKLINFIDKYSLKIEFIIETLSKYNINPNSVDYRTLETEKDRMRKMINYLGGNTKDARDLEDFFNKRIDEAIANIVLNEVRR